MPRSKTTGLQQFPGEQVPTYVRGRGSNDFVAHFGSGATIQVERGRTRRYPGLSGPAPQTQYCYRHFVDQGPRTGQIVDVGCGAGLGLRWLLQATSARLIGIDSDGRAVAFARQYVPDVEFLHADAESHRLRTAGCMAVVVDVIGMQRDPVALLRGMAARIDQLDAVFLAEPEASHRQELLSPVRRAFSIQTLTSVLFRAGYQVARVEPLSGGMLCAIAHPSRDPAAERLREAERAYQLHQSGLVIELCEAIRACSCPALRAEALLLEARLRFDLEQRDRAIALLSDARILIPTDARPVAGLARLALTTGSISRAVQLAEQAVKVDPFDFSAACSLALVYASEQHDRSVTAWSNASTLAPDDFIVAQLAFAAALIENRHAEGLAFVERLGCYAGRTSRVNEHAGLAGLMAAAHRRYLAAGALADSLLPVLEHDRPWQS